MVGSLALGTRERAVMVEVAGQQLLLGVTPGQVTTLHVFDVPVIGANAGDKNESGYKSEIGHKNEYGSQQALNKSDFGSKIREIMSKSLAP